MPVQLIQNDTIKYWTQLTWTSANGQKKFVLEAGPLDVTRTPGTNIRKSIHFIFHSFIKFAI